LKIDLDGGFHVHHRSFAIDKNHTEPRAFH
jgi:hypothetical protein